MPLMPTIFFVMRFVDANYNCVMSSDAEIVAGAVNLVAVLLFLLLLLQMLIRLLYLLSSPVTSIDTISQVNVPCACLRIEIAWRCPTH